MTFLPESWRIQRRREPELNPRGVRYGPQRLPFWRKRRFGRYWLWAKLAIILALGTVLLYPVLKNAPKWPLAMTVRHISAFPNCASARAVGLAPSKRGEPGYWSHLDADRDGNACEPYGRG
jgi:ABC-type Fe3+ transport system permease subunit